MFQALGDARCHKVIAMEEDVAAFSFPPMEVVSLCLMN